MLRINHDFIGTVAHQPLSTVESRIKALGNWTVIGRDASNNRDILGVRLGNPSRPTLTIIGSLHGSEWHGTQFLLSFLEQIKDGSFSDRKLRNKLLLDYQLVCIPCANPHGYVNQIRENSTGTDLNRDFDNFTQPETRAIRDYINSFSPIGFLDLHLMVESYQSRELVFGCGSWNGVILNETMSNALEVYSKTACNRWEPSSNNSMSRVYFSTRSNPYLPETQTFISEITRDGYFSNAEIYRYGMAQIYAYLVSMVHYYEKRLQIIRS